ncbi:hypothetical protein S7335_4150 [Synechococcus sp. PCC 7335]|nr:hypothetical protein S7335_4150 [Synechococcus sp. PCC 7335]
MKRNPKSAYIKEYVLINRSLLVCSARSKTLTAFISKIVTKGPSHPQS